MPWKECNVMDERLKFIARADSGESVVATTLKRSKGGRFRPACKSAAGIPMTATRSQRSS